MAAKYSTVVNELIKGVLDGIHNGHIVALITDVYGGDESAIPVVEYFGGKPITSLDEIEKVDGLTVFREGEKTTFKLSASASQGTLPDADQWLRLLAGKSYSWRHALFTSDVFVQGNKFQDDPMRRIFAPAYGMVSKLPTHGIRLKPSLLSRRKTIPVAAISRLSRLGCRKRRRFSSTSLRSALY